MKEIIDNEWAINLVMQKVQESIMRHRKVHLKKVLCLEIYLDDPLSSRQDQR